MLNLQKFVGLVFCVCSSPVFATDIINQDQRPYTVKVQGEGKLSISTHKVGAGGSHYGLCNYSFCTFEIPISVLGEPFLRSSFNDRFDQTVKPNCRQQRLCMKRGWVFEAASCPT